MSQQWFFRFSLFGVLGFACFSEQATLGSGEMSKQFRSSGSFKIVGLWGY